MELLLSDVRWMVAPLLACLLLSATLVYMGIHVLARQVIFVDLALAQIAALGATYATVLGYDAMHGEDSLPVALFSLAFTFVGAGLFAVARMKRDRVPQEAFIGIVYASASAAAILILARSPTGGEQLRHMMVGDILLVSMPTIATDAGLFAMVGVIHVIFRRKFLAISMNAAAVQQSGVNIRAWDLLFYMTFGVLVTRSVAVAGVLLVFSYLIVPAVIAQMWREGVANRLILGWSVAVAASVTGILVSFWADYPTGPTVVMSLASFLVVSGVLYYVIHAPVRARAMANIAAMALFAVVFFGVLSQFEKQPEQAAAAPMSVTDTLLEELNHEGAAQLEAVGYLGEIVDDDRVAPALMALLDRTDSEQIVEGVATALGALGDARAVPALQAAASRGYDAFLRLSLASALVELSNSSGYEVALDVLADPDAGFARFQALELISAAAGEDFDYDPLETVDANQAAFERIELWVRELATREGSSQFDQ